MALGGSNARSHLVRLLFGRRLDPGFTLVELMIVVVILGILFAIALPNFASMRSNAKRAACLSNQRNLVAHVQLYAADNNIRDATINCNVLIAGAIVPASLLECPTSEVDDRDDYEIELVDGVVIDITCLVRGVEHEWSP